MFNYESFGFERDHYTGAFELIEYFSAEAMPCFKAEYFYQTTPTTTYRLRLGNPATRGRPRLERVWERSYTQRNYNMTSQYSIKNYFLNSNFRHCQNYPP